MFHDKNIYEIPMIYLVTYVNTSFLPLLNPELGFKNVSLLEYIELRLVYHFPFSERP
ncbi:hypothetical protein MIDIC_170024 [Alphaproteobacteria bacterium]